MILCYAIVLHCYYIERDYFNKASSKLKWIQLGVAGVENSLIEEVIKSKVIITNSSGIHVGPVSEYVFAAILYLLLTFLSMKFLNRLEKNYSRGF